MIGLDILKQLMGSWTGTNRLWLSPAEPPLVSASTASVAPVADWGWRLAIEPAGGSAFHLRMYNISPAGGEDLAVEASFSRAR